MREHNPTPARKLASRVGLSGLPRCYRPRDAACHRLRVVVCAQRSPRPSSTTHGCNLADRRRRPRRCQPRRLSAGWTARTSWRPHPALRVGTLSARRKTGRADARCHRRGRACPLGGTGSPRRSLGGEEDAEVALRSAASVAGTHATYHIGYRMDISEMVFLFFIGIYASWRLMTACVTAGSIDETGVSSSTQGSPPK